MYSIKEVFYTLQGEGANAGRAAVFCRFAGCNLWSGLEKDRATAACKFCDTDFRGTNGLGGGKFSTAAALARHASEFWAGISGKPLIVCTGGEPLLQLDDDLVAALHAESFEIAVETNGTIEIPGEIDWVCVSPKADSQMVVTKGNELKMVFPQADLTPEQFENLEFDHFFLQPMDGPSLAQNTQLAIDHCLHHPRWRLSLQTHKIVGLR